MIFVYRKTLLYELQDMESKVVSYFRVKNCFSRVDIVDNNLCWLMNYENY